MQRCDIRVGVHYHLPVIEEQGLLKTFGPYARFLQALASCVSELTVFGFSPSKKGMLALYVPDTKIEAENIRYVNIGIRPNLFTCYFRYGCLASRIIPSFGSIDAMLVRTPTSLSGLFFDYFKGPKGAYLIGDYLEAIGTTLKPGIKLLAAKVLIYGYTVKLKRHLRNMPFAVNSSYLTTLWKKRGIVADIPVVPSGTLRASEQYFCNDRFGKKPYRALMVGRIYRSKGVAEAVEALSRCEKGAFVFDVVGPVEELGLDREIKEKYRDLEIHFHGNVPMGERLWAFYRQADLFLLPSCGSEGFPRVLWEAAAFSVPIITSNTESIRSFFTHDIHCLMTEPRDIRSLTESIQRVSSDRTLSARIIAHARMLSSQATVENRTELLVQYFYEKWKTEIDKKRLCQCSG